MGTLEKNCKEILKERAVGTKGNNEVLDFLERYATTLQFQTQALEFDCLVWGKGASGLTVEDKEFEIFPSPYSRGYNGSCLCITVSTLEELKKANCEGKLVVLAGELAKESLQPKDYPFYYPEEHKEITDTLEASGALALLAVTETSNMHGMSPFPLFDDGNFLIPSAYISKGVWEDMKEVVVNKNVKVVIDSSTTETQSRQLIFNKNREEGKETVLVCAHMDTKYDTPGALDNGTGVLMLMEMMKQLQGEGLPYNIDFVPFNSEEYFSAAGELAYMAAREGEKYKLVVNMDSPGHIGSFVDISSYNFSEDEEKKLVNLLHTYPKVGKGEPWYAGDHAGYAMGGIPCLAVASSDMFFGGLNNTHTPRDKIGEIDCDLVEEGAVFLSEFIKKLN